MEDDYADKDNNLNVFAHGFLTYTFGLSFPLLQRKLNGMLAAHDWNEGKKKKKKTWNEQETIRMQWKMKNIFL